MTRGTEKKIAVVAGVWFGVFCACIPAIVLATFLGLPSEKMWIPVFPMLVTGAVFVPVFPVLMGWLMYMLMKEER